MSRSIHSNLRVRFAFPAFIGLVAFASAPAHADMDSLLGDWTNHASSQAGDQDQSAEQLELTGLQDADLDLNETFDFAQPTVADQQPDSAETASDPVDQDDSTLTSNHGAFSGVGSPNQTQSLYAPTVIQNPYATSSCGCSTCQAPSSASCGCSANCGGGKGCCQAGGRCGELVSRCEAKRLCGKSECRPHQAPTLPPPSTFLQYFQSRNAYSAIWAGYADETRQRCRNRSPHIPGNHGSGNCGSGNCGSTQCGELLERGSVNCGSGNCGSGCGCK